MSKKVHGNWSSVGDLRANELNEFASSIINNLYSVMMTQAIKSEVHKDGNVIWTAVPWVKAVQNVALRQLQVFIEALRGEKRGSTSWAVVSMRLPGGKSPFDPSVDTYSWVHDFITRRCNSIYNTDLATFRQMLADQDPKAMMPGNFLVTQWFALQEARRFEAKTVSYARLFCKEWLQASVALPLIHDMQLWFDGMVGHSFDSYADFAKKADEYWNTFVLNKMIARTHEILEKGDVETPVGPVAYGADIEEMLAEYNAVKSSVDHAAARQVLRGDRAYLPADSFQLVDLCIGCDKVGHYLFVMDVVNPYISASERADFERTYRAVFEYRNLMCSSFVRRKIVYDSAYSITPLVVSDMLSDLDDIWDEWLSESWSPIFGGGRGGPWLFSEAEKKGLLDQLNLKLENAKKSIVDKITALEDDPWSGPVTRRGDGVSLPFNAFDSGPDLYRYWIRNLVGDQFWLITAWIEGEDKQDTPGGFVLSADHARILLQKFYPDFEAALGGVRTNSVMLEQWSKFHAFILANVGTAYDSRDEFDEAVDHEKVADINAGEKMIEELRNTTASSMPPEFDLYKSKVDSGAVETMTDYALANDFSALKLLNRRVPWTYNARKAYEDVYKAYWDAMDRYAGGPFEIPGAQDVEQFVKGVMSELDAKTESDGELLKEVFGSRLELDNNLLSFETVLRGALGATIGGKPKTNLELYKERVAVRHKLEAGLQAYLDSIVPQCIGRFDEVINKVKQAGTELPAELEDQANRLLQVTDPRMKDKVDELFRLLKKATGTIGAALRPFMPFTPLKSKGGFSMEEFNLRQIDDLMEAWVKPRLTRGVMVEPKIDGYRMALHVRGGDVRIYLEGDINNLAPAYPELVMEASKLPDVILDGELVEEVDGHIAPRIETGMYTRLQLDSAAPVFLVFDILFAEGNDIHRLPYSERRKKLSEFFARYSPKHIRELPSWYVTSVEGAKQRIDQARAFGGSEGAMLKVSDSEYEFARDTEDWAKIKRMEDVNVVILGVEKNDNGMYNYECGVSYFGNEGVSEDHVKRYEGRPYMVLGTTFGAGEKLSIGDRIEVAVTKIIRYEDDTGYWYEWQDPKVKARVKCNPDTIGQVVNIGKLLGASISHPYRVLMDLYDESLGTSSVEALQKIHNKASALFNMLNFPRLRRIALMVLTTIEDRITPSGSAGEKATPNKPGEVAGNIASVSMDLVKILEEKFEGVRDSVDMMPSMRKNLSLNLLAGIRQAYAAASDTKVLDRLADLRDRVQKYSDSLGNVEDLSALDIERKLKRLEGDVYEAFYNKQDRTRVKVALDVKKELNEMLEKNIVTSVYDDIVQRIFKYIDDILGEGDGKYSSSEVQSKLIDIEGRINSASDNLSLGLGWGKEQTKGAYIDLVQLIEDMTPSQLTAFGRQTDLLLDRIRELWTRYMPDREMPNALSGALPSVNIYDLLKQAKFGPGYLDPFLYEKFMKGGWDELNDRAQKIELAVIDRMPEIQDGADPHDVIDECVKKVDEKLNAEFGKQFDLHHPRPLGTYSGERSLWVDQSNMQRVIGIPQSAFDEIQRGHTVLLVGKDDEWRVAAVRGKSGELLNGDPDIHRQTMLKRVANSLQTDRMFREVREDFGEQGVAPLERGARRALNGVVEVGDGNGFFGGYVNGKPFVVTTLHGVVANPNEVIRTPDGRTFVGRLLWRTPGGTDWANIRDKDVAIYVVDGDFSNLIPLSLDSTSSDRYGVVVSPYYGEADLVDCSGEFVPGWDKYTETERTRRGYSGSPVVDSLGRVIGMWNAGDSRWGDADATGGAISADAIRRAYREAGITGNERLQSGLMQFRRRIMAAVNPFAIAPFQIPVHGALYDVRSEGRDDKLLVFDWNGEADLPIAIFIGGPADEGKLLNYQGGKLQCEVGRDLPGDRREISKVLALPSRMRAEKGGGYYEFYLNFERVVGLNGLWGISEKAGRGYGVPALMFRLEGMTPFWARRDARHKEERARLPEWQKPDALTVKKFLERGW